MVQELWRISSGNLVGQASPPVLQDPQKKQPLAFRIILKKFLTWIYLGKAPKKGKNAIKVLTSLTVR